MSAQQAVSGLGLQVLVLADVGMDQLTSYLAFARMAPVQVAFWGHPSTTGQLLAPPLLAGQSKGCRKLDLAVVVCVCVAVRPGECGLLHQLGAVRG